jgi:hypothetical protein
MSSEKQPPFDIAEAFLNLQRRLLASYRGIRAVTAHGPTIGDESEVDWIKLIRDFLPARYEVGKVFAVDHEGSLSEQIDVAVYDKQYTPLWFGAHGGTQFIPIEGIYAVFEVKPSIHKRELLAAYRKIKSVRCLKRTSAPIAHAGGRFEPVALTARPIMGGILASGEAWSRRDVAKTKLAETLRAWRGDDELCGGGALDIGIALQTIAFDFTPTANGDDDYQGARRAAPLNFSGPDRQLVHFVIRLFRQLQPVGTTVAMEMQTYERRLTEELGAASNDETGSA